MRLIDGSVTARPFGDGGLVLEIVAATGERIGIELDAAKADALRTEMQIVVRGEAPPQDADQNPT